MYRWRSAASLAATAHVGQLSVLLREVLVPQFLVEGQLQPEIQGKPQELGRQGVSGAGFCWQLLAE